MDASKFYKIIAILVAIIVVVWLTVYYLNNRQTASVPVPSATNQDSAEANRQALLNLLKDLNSQPISEAERQKMLESLKSGQSTTPLTDTERQQLLESLKANQ